MYDNLLFLNIFLFPPKKKEDKKENEVAKPVLDQLLSGSNRLGRAKSINVCAFQAQKSSLLIFNL